MYRALGDRGVQSMKVSAVESAGNNNFGLLAAMSRSGPRIDGLGGD